MAAGSSIRQFLIVWGLFLAVLAVAALQPMQRTQEARVLLTAAEMHDEPPGRGWLVPVCNGEIRLAKPPLAYWLSAASVRVFGVNVFAGRLPMVIAAWLAAGVTFLLARLFFGSRAGLFAAVTLMATLLVVRYGTLAETDGLSMLFVGAAMYALVRAAIASEDSAAHSKLTMRRPLAGWLHLAAVFTALTILAKGAPAVFILIFAIVLAVVAKDARVLTRFISSGAIVTLLILAVPWFWYVRTLPEAGPALELEYYRLSGRGGHNEAPWYYLIDLPRATAPGAALLILAAAAAISHWRRDARLRVLLAWLGAVLLVLSITPQKQPHYLMPLLPALAAVGGWMMDRALSADDPPLRRALKWVLAGMIIAGVAAGVAFPVAGRAARGWVQMPDIALGLLTIVAIVCVLLLWRRRRLGAVVTSMLLAASFLIAAITAWWAPSLRPGIVSDRQIAAEINARYRGRPYAYLMEEDLPLAFFLGRVMPTLQDAWPAAGIPEDAVIIEASETHAPAPDGFVERFRYPTRNGDVRVYTKDAPATRPASPSGASPLPG